MAKRKLTAGEILLAKTIFGNQIDYDKVIIRNDTLPGQPSNTVMTPGDIH